MVIKPDKTMKGSRSSWGSNDSNWCWFGDNADDKGDNGKTKKGDKNLSSHGTGACQYDVQTGF